ncbi:unnamed protein product [Spirodela intermedia]|uniref:Uncharacterized protein n=1 Tax=Spirodela intermedia TaxID=51605 RepID=A0A7I8JNK3_SPIIN|nr:unnamed protein product [Spirodela intermedia]CAA6671163.1 unnamed protein product [Spirodela intermedia]
MFTSQSEKNGSNDPLLADELQWVVRIRRILDEEEEEEEDGHLAVSIFRIPSALLAGKSTCYVPQVVGLGPYHRWRPELHAMDRRKLSAARRAGKRLLSGLRLHHVVDRLAGLHHRLRASYHGHLDFNGETLAWAMAIDGAFLLELLEMLLRAPCGGASDPEADFAAKKCTGDMLLRDLIMLENQQPPGGSADGLLAEMAAELVKVLCPFTPTTDAAAAVAAVGKGSSHLLEVLYDVIVPKQERCPVAQETTGDQASDDAAFSDGFISGKLSTCFGHARKLSFCLRRAAASRPAKLLVGIPCRVAANLPAIAPLMLLLENLLSDSYSKDGEDAGGEGPLPAEEMAIPSVADLAGAGVRFSPARGGPTRVAFDGVTATLLLPVVRLDVNTEATLRNLVAYEAAYVELMNGIIDVAEDVRRLREAGVVRNYMKSDGEAAELWNGMSRSVQLTRVPSIDEAIRELNQYYNRRWRVKLCKLLKGRGAAAAAHASCIALLFFFFFFMGFNAFCIFGRCNRLPNESPPPVTA